MNVGMSSRSAIGQMVRRVKSKEASEILGIDVHHLKLLREHGLLIGTKCGKGYVFDTEDLENFIRITRGFDLSNPNKIAETAYILQAQKKLPHQPLC